MLSQKWRSTAFSFPYLRSLLEAGASVVAHLGRSGREDEPLLETFGPDRVHTLHGDLAIPGEATRLFQVAIDWQGRVDVLGVALEFAQEPALRILKL